MQNLLKKALKIYLLLILLSLSIIGLSSVLSQEIFNWDNTSSSSISFLQLLNDADSIQRTTSSEEGKEKSPFYLKDPSNVKTEVEYHPETNEYSITKKIGNIVLDKEYMSFKEYQDKEMDKLLNNYWKERSKSSTLSNNKASDDLLQKYLPGAIDKLGSLKDVMGTVLGGPTIEITPTGSAELIFSIIHNKRLDPSWDVRQQKTTNFNFDQNLQLGVNAKIGDKINFDLNYNTQAIFDFENKFKLQYEGKEDDILQLLEAGNVSFGVNSSLIQGSQNLFGIHTKLKFGNLFLDIVGSEQKSENKNMKIENGVQKEKFSIKAIDYDENRHYLLAQYFYEHYNQTMSTLPILNTNINILRVEVWRTNIGSAVTENRNIVAFADLGEKNPHAKFLSPGTSQLPDNNKSNNLLGYIDPSMIRNTNQVNTYLHSRGFVAGIDYERVENARRLNQNEYNFNPRLGFISLNTPLAADQVLAVAFQYQIIGDTTVYQVGEFSDDGIADPNSLVLKLLKSTMINTRIPLWNLMMKNVYFLNTQQISPENFSFNIFHVRNEGGIPLGFFDEGPKSGIPLIQIFGLDKLDYQQNPYPDGVFDFLDKASSMGGLIESSTGRIYFPTIEPFGKDLRALLGDDKYADQLCFDSLYTMTKVLAEQHPEQNRYFMEGMYTSALGNEISIGFNVPPGSVRVLAGGIPLVENVDYIVDYMMGRVKILNQGVLNSGTPITITNENNALFNMSVKRMLGLNATYQFSKNMSLGASILNLHERVQLTKNDYGYEPISNTIWGTNFSYQEEVPLITRLVDALPGINTKAPSDFTFTTEFAQFIPGISKMINTERGTIYIDAFEGAKLTTDLKAVLTWHLASTPRDYSTPNPMFRETEPGSGIEYGMNRAKLAWYRISDVFYYNSPPGGLTKDDLSRPYVRRIHEQEVFPNKELAAGERISIQEFNLAYYPSEKGPYNYDVKGSRFSDGMEADGSLKNPKSRWGGIMRKIENPDFETANIEYIEFWMMDPFIENPNHKGGKLVFNLGDISEDILRDGRLSAENGMPTGPELSNIDTTIWGRVPRIRPIVHAFDNDPNSRKYQDIGLDGLNSLDEKSFFSAYLDEIAAQYGINSDAYKKAIQDPSSDDYMFFRSTQLDQAKASILERYKHFNNPEGNSAIAQDNNENFSTSGSSYPNQEDINNDNTLSEIENYFQYIVSLKPEDMEIGKNFITNIHEAKNVLLVNESRTNCKWYQFKIPIKSPSQVVGTIDNFQSIRFIRMFLKDFDEQVVLRFATLELVQGTWRRYTKELRESGDYINGGEENTNITVASVSIDEDGTRYPVPYVLPPNVARERTYSASSYTQQNEQALSLTVENLSDGDARAIFKVTDFDFRYYNNLKMFVHAEKLRELDNPKRGDLSLFVRIGTDFSMNYYEYELPLNFTPWGVAATDDYLIWPEDNNVEINLQKLVEIKENRNRLIRSGTPGYSMGQSYSEIVNGRKITVVGTPNLGKVKSIMIGVRNPRKKNADDGDNMQTQSAIIWVNELRLTDFKNEGGFAANALARTNLADLGSVSVFAAYSSAFFGPLDQRISNLGAMNISSIDFSSDIELGKFLPEESGIKIPVHYDYSVSTDRPQFNPLDEDVLLSRDLKTYESKEVQDSIRNIVQTQLTHKNINFMNVRKERTGQAPKDPRFYEIENFDFSYAYSKITARSIDIEYNNAYQHRGGFNYAFSPIAKPYKPFGQLKNKNLLLLSDFGLFYKVRSVSFRTELSRNLTENKIRNNGASSGLIIIPTTYFKQFYWSREYGLQYDLTTNFKIQYTSHVNALIDEPIGKIDSPEKRDTVWQSLKNFGRTMDFRQNLSFNWDVPINKIPYAEWIRLNTSYVATYSYIGTNLVMKRMGNTIESGSTFDVNSTFNLATLYKRIHIFDQLNPKKPPGKPAVKATNAKPEDTKKAEDTLSNVFTSIAKQSGLVALRLLSAVKTVNIKYSQQSGMLIPGFMPEVKIVGLSPYNQWMPGWRFILGRANQSIMDEIIGYDLYSKDTLMNNPFQMQHSKILSARATVEPLKDLNIDLIINRTYTDKYMAYYKYDPNISEVVGPRTPIRGGAYSTTIWMFMTSFKQDNGRTTMVFEEFLRNRITIANRLALENPNTDPNDLVYDSINRTYFPRGYSASSQQVLLPALLAAYLKEDANTVSYSPFLNMVLPNWNIQYSGFSKMEFFKRWFSNISFSNSYKANYTVANFSTDVRLGELAGYGYGSESIVNPISGNFIPLEIVDQIVLQEQFAPLIRVDMTLKNSLLLNVEYRTARMISMSISNTQLTETTSKGFVIGSGFRIKDVTFDIKTNSLTKNLKSDIILKVDLAWTQNRTILRRINQHENPVSAGGDVFSLALSGEYAITEKLTAKLFFQTTVNTPALSTSIPNSTTEGGISIRFSL